MEQQHSETVRMAIEVYVCHDCAQMLIFERFLCSSESQIWCSWRLHLPLFPEVPIIP